VQHRSFINLASSRNSTGATQLLAPFFLTLLLISISQLPSNMTAAAFVVERAVNKVRTAPQMREGYVLSPSLRLTHN
jgi:hypothetical protein